MNKECLCRPGDPCDYHAATCVVCADGKCLGHPTKDFCVALEGKSITAMGEPRYWEIHLKAESEEGAIEVAKKATSHITIFDTSYRVTNRPECPPGSYARLEVGVDGKLVR